MGPLYCDGCGQEITEDDYCTPHEFECLNAQDDELFVECTCDLHYHTACCPVCNCEGTHPRHYGELWTCSRCGGRFCWAEGTDNRPDLCDRCWMIEMEGNP